MFLDGNKKSFSRLFVALLAPAAAVALLLAAPAQGRGPDRLGPRDDWDALPCQMQSIPNPEGEGEFGYRLAIDGDVAAVYTTVNHHVHVLRFDGAEWQHEAVLSPDDGWLTGEVAVSGHLIIAGAYMDSTFGHDTGAGYVYRYDGSGWVRDDKLFASDPHDDMEFGCDVAVDGNVILIGAHDYNFGEDIGPGAAYVFERIGDQWVEQAKLLASDGQMDDCFGDRVLVDGETILIAASGPDVFYYFQRVGETWIEQQRIDTYGTSDLSGDHFIIGRAKDDEHGENAGAAFVYELTGGTWVFRQKLVPHDPGELQEFGRDVAILGHTALIGSVGFDSENDVYISAWAYVFRLGEGSWHEVVKLDGDAPLWWEFGKQVALGGDHAIVGAPAMLSNQGGTVFLYAGMTGVDCNDNHIADFCDIFLGTSEDLNENGIPDECECPADFDGDGDVDTADLLYLLSGWGTPDGDVDFDGDTDTADLLALLAAWGECP
jgi:hypothetical protein